MKYPVPHNTRQNPVSPVPAILLAARVEDEVEDLLTGGMRYVKFDYNPQIPRLLQAPPEPQFPAISGRLAWCNGKFIHEVDTSVTYRRGRKVITEWHALASVGV